MASTEIDKHVALTISTIALFVRMNNTRVHTYIAVDPFPSGKISRVAFLVMVHQEVQRDFEGGDNSRCSEILRKYGN